MHLQQLKDILEKSSKKEALDDKDKPFVKDLVKKLRGGSKTHAKQADDLEKADEIILGRGENFHVYRGLRHQMIALEDTELFEFSTQHFEDDSYRVIRGD